jgi:Mrp family chromosome partitioning ATPase
MPNLSFDDAMARLRTRSHQRARAGGGPHIAIEDMARETGPKDAQGRGVLKWPMLVHILESEYHDRFGSLADGIVAAVAERSVRVLLFTSSHRAEGRTTLLLTLARALGGKIGKAILVDADLTGPMVARQLGFLPRVGLEDVVERDVPWSDAVVASGLDHLSILPLRAAVARPKEFLASPGWSCLMARLRREYELVLVDGSPLFAGLSAALLHRMVDAAVLVHRQGLTSYRAVSRACEVLDSSGIPLLGLAETFVPGSEAVQERSPRERGVGRIRGVEAR